MENDRDDMDDDVPDDPSSSIDDAGERAWQSIELFRLTGGYASLRVRRDSYEAMRRDICARTNTPCRSVVQFHEVAAAPPDLEASGTVPIIMQRTHDLIPGEELFTVLLDVAFYNGAPAHQIEVVRSIKLFPEHVHRNQLIRVLGLEDYCYRVKKRCLVWLNHRLQQLQSTTTMRIQHGDFIRIALPPWANGCAMPTRLAASLAIQGVPNRRMFSARSSAAYTDAIDHMPVQRWRLDSLGFRPDQGDPSFWSPEHDDDMHSLMQEPPPPPRICLGQILVGIELPEGYSGREEEQRLWHPDSNVHNTSADMELVSDDDDQTNPFNEIMTAWNADVRLRPQDDPPNAVFLT